MLEVIETGIEGLLLLQPRVFNDDRGYFYECFQLDRYANVGIQVPFVQDNISKSVKNTIRGLHFQTGEKAQGKLCQALLGEVLDVAVDIRKGSPTYGKHFAAILSDENHRQLWIPPGFAHGFSVLSETVLFHYKCSNFYSKQHEGSLLFNDSTLGIDWKVTTPVVSQKDLEATPFSEFETSFIY